MMDRLVCADGGNPDPTSTHGKEAAEAKAIELKGWDYPRHLKARIFSVITHGDSSGIESLRRNLHDWLTDMELVPAGPTAVFDRYIGYYSDGQRAAIRSGGFQPPSPSQAIDRLVKCRF